METRIEKKHTAGPWFIDTSLHVYGTGEIKHVNGQDGVTEQDFPHIGKINRYQDAKLIAAAPEMLEALEHTLAALEDAQKLHPAWIYTDSRNAAREAISKAKGA